MRVKESPLLLNGGTVSHEVFGIAMQVVVICDSSQHYHHASNNRQFQPQVCKNMENVSVLRMVAATNTSVVDRAISNFRKVVTSWGMALGSYVYRAAAISHTSIYLNSPEYYLPRPRQLRHRSHLDIVAHL